MNSILHLNGLLIIPEYFFLLFFYQVFVHFISSSLLGSGPLSHYFTPNGYFTHPLHFISNDFLKLFMIISQMNIASPIYEPQSSL